MISVESSVKLGGIVRCVPVKTAAGTHMRTRASPFQSNFVEMASYLVRHTLNEMPKLVSMPVPELPPLQNNDRPEYSAKKIRKSYSHLTMVKFTSYGILNQKVEDMAHRMP
jgi:hypothetical protein